MALRDYQVAGADFLRARSRGMMLAPVGAGKTATVLTANFPVSSPARLNLPCSVQFTTRTGNKRLLKKFSSPSRPAAGTTAT